MNLANDILDKAIKVAIVGGIAYLSYEIIKCKANGEEITTCLIGDFFSQTGTISGALTGGIVNNRINQTTTMVDSIAGGITCAIFGKKLKGGIKGAFKSLFSGQKIENESC